MIKSQGAYEKIGVKRVKPNTESFTYKEKEYPISVEHPSFISGKNYVYLYDIRNGQLYFKTENIKLENFEALNRIAGKQIVDQLTTNLIEKPSITEKIMYIVCGVGVGLFVGYIVAQVLMGGM
jgi:hypothetical protein